MPLGVESSSGTSRPSSKSRTRQSTPSRKHSVKGASDFSAVSQDNRRICRGCNLGIKGSRVSALEADFHPDCFKCKDCNVVLSGQKYFRYEQTGVIYPMCFRDYSRRTDNICAVCDEPIIDDCVVADKKKYHPEHFQCAECGERLSPHDKSVIRRGNLYCHYHQAINFASRCTACKEGIFGPKKEDPEGVKGYLHPACYYLQKEWQIRVDQYRPPPQAVSKKIYLDIERGIEDLVEGTQESLTAFHASINACLSNLEIRAASSQWMEALKMTESLKQHIDAVSGYNEAIKASMRLARPFEISLAENVPLALGYVDSFHKAIWRSRDRLMPPERLNSEIIAICASVEETINNLLSVIVASTFKLFFIPQSSSKLFNEEATRILFDLLKTVPRVLPIKGSSRRKGIVSPSISSLAGSPSPSKSPILSNGLPLPDFSMLSLSPRVSMLPSSPSGSSTAFSDAGSDIFYLSSEENWDAICNISLDKLCKQIADTPGPSDARRISAIEWRKEASLPKHEYLLIEVTSAGRNSVWLRLERAAKRNFLEGKNLNLMSVSSRFAADDQASLASSRERLIALDKTKSTQYSRVSFPNAFTLGELGALISCVMKGSEMYTLHTENCWFFCSVITELAVATFKGVYHSAFSLQHSTLGSAQRQKIKETWKDTIGY